MATKLVRYVSPFGSPAWMPESRAKALLEADDALWVRLSQEGLLENFVPPGSQAPRIERH